MWVPTRSRGRSAEPPERPALRYPRSDAGRRLDERLELGQQLLDRGVATSDGVEQLKSDFWSWDEFNERLLKQLFTTDEIADHEYVRQVFMAGGFVSPQVELQQARRDIDMQKRRLQSIRDQLELFDAPEDPALQIVTQGPREFGQEVFLVHGHNDAVKLEVAEFLERITGRRPIILHEPADAGLTIIEKFETYAAKTGFAVVLLTADDLGKARDADELRKRPRQNVVLELGFFLAALGRGRVVALCEGDVEKPSDIDGVLYKLLAGNWKYELVKEMRAAGIDLDANRA